MLRTLVWVSLSLVAVAGPGNYSLAQDSQPGGVAILGKIPYVGMLFGADNDQDRFRQRNEMVLPLINDIDECPSPMFGHLENHANNIPPQGNQMPVIDGNHPEMQQSHISQAVFNRPVELSCGMLQSPQMSECSDAILAECLANSQLEDRVRAELILNALISIRRQSRDEAFAEILERQNHQARIPMPLPTNSMQQDPYFTPARADLQMGGTNQMQEILVRLEQQQLLLQNQVRQMQEWQGFLGIALRDIQDQITQINMENTNQRGPVAQKMQPSNEFRLPSYARDASNNQQALNPMSTSNMMDDRQPNRNSTQIANELAYLESLQEKIRQRLEVIGKLYPNQPSNHYAYPAELRTSTPGTGPLLPR